MIVNFLSILDLKSFRDFNWSHVFNRSNLNNSKRQLRYLTMMSNLFYSIKIRRYMTSLFIVHGFQIYDINGPANLGISRLRFVIDLDISTTWYMTVIFIVEQLIMNENIGDIIAWNPILNRESVHMFGWNSSEFTNRKLGDHYEW